MDWNVDCIYLPGDHRDRLTLAFGISAESAPVSVIDEAYRTPLLAASG
jgi:hypothetical protein